MIFELIDSSEESTQETIEEESFLPPSSSSPPPSPPPLPHTPSPLRPPSTPPPSPPQCRICFEIEQFDDPLLHPCLCNGTSKFVHKYCLQKWRKMNYNKPPFFKCMECNFRYIIKYSTHREFFFYSSRNLHALNSILKTLVMNILMFCVSLFLQTIMIELKYNPIYLIDNKPTSSFLKISNGETLYGHIYYYSFTIFLLSAISHISFLISTFRVINKKKYWNKMIMRFILHYIFSLQFIWVYYICKAEHNSSPKTFLNFEILYNLVHFNMFGKLLLAHNKILIDINSDNIGYVKNRLLII